MQATRTIHGDTNGLFIKEFLQEPKSRGGKHIGCNIGAEGGVPAVSIGMFDNPFKVLLVLLNCLQNFVGTPVLHRHQDESALILVGQLVVYLFEEVSSGNGIACHRQ